MPGLLIRDMPVEVHRRLKELARANRRSTTKQALILLEEALGGARRRVSLENVRPVRANVPITDWLIEEAIRRGRP